MNHISVLHGYRTTFIDILNKGGTTHVLLTYKDCNAFKAQALSEELFGGKCSGRLDAEWDTTYAILKDILVQMVSRYGKPIENLKEKFYIK